MGAFDKKGGYRPPLGPKNSIPPWKRSPRPMRTTTEVIEAARLGDPCTEEELRLCIVSMREISILAHGSHGRWSIDERLPASIRLKAEAHWNNINEGWNTPLDKRVRPKDYPGHPSLKHRKRMAEAVWDSVMKKGKTE